MTLLRPVIGSGSVTIGAAQLHPAYRCCGRLTDTIGKDIPSDEGRPAGLFVSCDPLPATGEREPEGTVTLPWIPTPISSTRSLRSAHMLPAAMAVRLAGDTLLAIGASRRSAALTTPGVLTILIGWAGGPLVTPGAQGRDR